MKDYSIKASELKSLIRSWRARGVKPIDTMRVMLLYLGAERYMDMATGLYLSASFNQMRKEYKYRDAATLLQVVITSGSFRVVRRREDDLIVAFYSPFVVRQYALPDHLYETSGLPAGVSGSDSSLLKTHTKDVYKYRPSLVDGHIENNSGGSLEEPPEGEEIVGAALGPHGREEAEEQVAALVARWEGLRVASAGMGRPSRRDRKHFRKEPLPMARENLEYFFGSLATRHYDQWLRIFNPLHEALTSHGLTLVEASYAIDLYTKRRIIPHMECRRGIENWNERQIAGWAQSFMQQRYLSLRLHECLQLWRLIGRAYMEEDIEKHEKGTV